MYTVSYTQILCDVFVWIFMRDCPFFDRKNRDCQSEKFANILMKQISKVLRNNNHFYCYFIALSKKYFLYWNYISRGKIFWKEHHCHLLFYILLSPKHIDEVELLMCKQKIFKHWNPSIDRTKATVILYLGLTYKTWLVSGFQKKYLNETTFIIQQNVFLHKKVYKAY